MSENPPPAQELNVIGSAERLAKLMKDDLASYDKTEFKRGDDFLVFYQDPNFRSTFRNLNNLKIEVLSSAVVDLADRGRMMCKSYFGVNFANNRLQSFVSDLGQTPPGTLVFKVAVRNPGALMRWRGGQNDEMAPEDLHAAIYRLTVEWARTL